MLCTDMGRVESSTGRCGAGHCLPDHAAASYNVLLGRLWFHCAGVPPISSSLAGIATHVICHIAVDMN